MSKSRTHRHDGQPAERPQALADMFEGRRERQRREKAEDERWAALVGPVTVRHPNRPLRTVS